MNEFTGSGGRTASIAVIFSTVLMIFFNGLAAAGYVNDVTPAAVSGAYPTLLTPAGYAFSIWSLIYLGLIAFSIFQALGANAERFRRVRWLYVITCLLNCTWIYFWHHDQVAICLGIIVALLATLILIMIRLCACATVAETWFMQAPFGTYAGWVTAATLVNLMIWLKSIDSPLAASNAAAVGLILFSAACAVLVRLKLSNFFYPLAVAWAVTAIAVKQSGNTAIVVAAAACVVTCLITTGTFVVHLRDSTSE